ncbi:MAG: 4Fe-4S dicluster domain-containing protein [Desulfarculaceae bacterium]|nr:4Fe-4S dicluster domain-containing protein [Desulfarculaceae bacterium]MCF8073005.1 4Fe-4S dicluster domain-containing protein [Desulfarculaceae bacterium]MCF8100699.1 4Fe-4S dicluster domain-containing protein [Desulfarculaceae bacterium]MCF8115437.1 4Fe-4S dicluster domain-containing protein [Desulfarculaceae bacterium]
MAKQLGMVIDANACIDCKGCMVACKVANQVPGDNWRNWIKDGAMDRSAKSKKRMVFQPGNCMQCDKPTCVTACPTGATYKSKADGVVMINRDLCIGCGQCIKACPYGARYRNEKLKVADKCDFCSNRREVGLEPACVSTCPTKARAFGDLNDPSSPAGKLYAAQKEEAVQVVNAQSDTDPNIYYLGAPGDKHWPVKAQMPSAFTFWKNVADPGVKVLMGLMGVGVLAMLGKQLVMKNDAPEEHHGEDGHE